MPTESELDAVREAYQSAITQRRERWKNKDMNRTLLLIHVADTSHEYISALEAANSELRERLAAAEGALKPFAANNAAYLESSHIVNPGDYDTEYWNWIISRVSATYMRSVFEGAVKAYAAPAPATPPAADADGGAERTEGA